MLSALKVTSGKAGIHLELRVQPGARRPGIVGVHGDALKLAVNAPPEDGKANQAVIELLAELLGLPCRQVQITRGLSSRSKTVLISGITEGELRERLAALIPV
jgi:uncharacterized protein (TIGR00251 family)